MLQQTLVLVDGRDVAAGADCRFRGAEGRDRGFVQNRARVAHGGIAHPAGQDRFAHAALDFGQGACHAVGIDAGLGRQNHQHAVDVAVVVGGVDRGFVVLRAGVFGQINQVVQRGQLGQQRFQFGLANPTPVGVVFAFDADRSLDAIAKQARTLQEALAKPQHAPDLIVVLGKGLVGPRERTRDELNAVKLPKENNRMVVREVRQHTLLRFYLQLLNELNTITLAPLMLDDYLQMPELVDGHRVSGHGPFFQRAEGEPVPGVPPPLKKLSRDFLLKIIEATREVTPITYADHLRHSVGNVDLSLMPADWLKTTVIEYNPLNSPSMTDVGLDFTTANTAKPAYSPLHIKIDDQNVAVDGNSIGTDDLETSDVEFDEIFDSRPLHGKKRDE